MDLIERLINKDYLTERERKEWLGTIKESLETLERNSNKVIMDSIKVINRNLELQAENEKLKKAIEILKRRVISLKGIKDCESAAEYNRYTSLGLITQQEYELLKEVLGE